MSYWHKIVGNRPVTVFLSDQNFVANLEGKNGSYITDVRMEYVSLSELFELSRELLENVSFTEDSVFHYGSDSYLSCIGSGDCAGDWLLVVSDAKGQ
jgi:hypothetical protein